VSWPVGSRNPDYEQSASNTRVVGDQIGIVIDILEEEKGLKRADCHCVGHSLGSHVCGHAGKYSKIGRITGLDPAGPSYEDYSPDARLNSTDADFVDIWHTNPKNSLLLYLGMLQPIGHVDFYPNGGDLQPMCRDIKDLNSLARLLKTDLDIISKSVIAAGFLADTIGLCSHISAVLYWNEAMKDDCFKTRQRCPDHNDLPRSCSNSEVAVQSMGLSSIDYWNGINDGTFYVPVNKEQPYCVR